MCSCGGCYDRDMPSAAIGSSHLILTHDATGNTSRPMPVLTFKVPIEVAVRLQRAANRRRVAKSVVIREALEEKLGRSLGEASLYELMHPSLGALDSGKRDLGHNPEHLGNFGRQ
jgi:hypothetical protein